MEWNGVGRESGLPLPVKYNSRWLGDEGRGSPVFLITPLLNGASVKLRWDKESEDIGHGSYALDVSSQGYYIFLNKCFFICCMPLGQFPEISNDCFRNDFHQLCLFYWGLDLLAPHDTYQPVLYPIDKVFSLGHFDRYHYFVLKLSEFLCQRPLVGLWFNSHFFFLPQAHNSNVILGSNVPR